MAWHKVAKRSDVPEGEVVPVEVEGEPVALYNVGGVLYATHDICTHEYASLSGGYVDGDCIECPLHQGIFHIPTGTVVEGPVEVDLRTYPVKVEGEDVLIEA